MSYIVTIVFKSVYKNIHEYISLVSLILEYLSIVSLTVEYSFPFHSTACGEGIAENQCIQSSTRETLNHYELLQSYQQFVAQCCNV